MPFICVWLLVLTLCFFVHKGCLFNTMRSDCWYWHFGFLHTKLSHFHTVSKFQYCRQISMPFICVWLLVLTLCFLYTKIANSIQCVRIVFCWNFVFLHTTSLVVKTFDKFANGQKGLGNSSPRLMQSKETIQPSLEPRKVVWTLVALSPSESSNVGMSCLKPVGGCTNRWDELPTPDTVSNS